MQVAEEIAHLDFAAPPAEPGERAVDFERDPKICGICGLDKIRLSVKTTRKSFDVWVCTNIPEKERMPCDGYAYKNAVFNGIA